MLASAVYCRVHAYMSLCLSSAVPALVRVACSRSLCSALRSPPWPVPLPLPPPPPPLAAPLLRLAQSPLRSRAQLCTRQLTRHLYQLHARTCAPCAAVRLAPRRRLRHAPLRPRGGGSGRR